MKRIRIISLQIIFLTALSCCFISCKKMLGVDPPIETKTSEQVFSKTTTAVIAMTSVYNFMSNNSFLYNGFGSLSTMGSLLADELVPQVGLYDGLFERAYQNTILIEAVTKDLWINHYRFVIYPCNSVIEGVAKSNGISEKDKKILTGEAKFTRAFAYFYLLNLYGDVPLVTTTTQWQTTSIMGRTEKEKVYDQIVEDLLQAQELLTHGFLDANLKEGTIEKVRPNKMAATALLARVYLYRKEWARAEAEASKLISDPAYTLTAPDSTFLKNSKEAIWQWEPSPRRDNGLQKNTTDAEFFLPGGATAPFGNPNVWLSQQLIDEFEAGDKRRASWVKAFPTNSRAFEVPFKYKIGRQMGDNTISQEYTMVLRLGELYLIRAEARAQQNKLIGSNSAQSDIDIIRNRAGLNGTSATSKDDLLNAIDHERYVELFTELGHRWFDLKRREKINERMNIISPQKGGQWSPFKALLPIPYEEIKLNPSLRGKQNPGYPEA